MNLEDDILIERFLKGQLSDRELTAFRNRVSSDVAFKEQVTLEKQLFETLDAKYWSAARNEYAAEVPEDKALMQSDQAIAIDQAIAEANKKYKSQSRSKQLKMWFFYPAAAVIVFLSTFYFLIPSEKTTQELYLSYLDKSEAYAYGIRGEEKIGQELGRARLYYENEEYGKAEALFREILASGHKDGALYLNLAMSQMRLERFGEAEATLNQFIQSEIIDREKGFWYKGLLYLQAGDTDKAISMLNTIVENSHFNAQLAKELLKELE